MEFPRNEFLKRIQEKGFSENYQKAILDYADNLTNLKLPVIFDTRHLSLFLNINYSYLLNLLNIRSCFYKYFTIRKRKNGLRRIITPYLPIKIMQKWIKTNILDKVEVPDCVTAFTKQRSIVNNAKIHENAKFIKKIDIKNFFESVDLRMVYCVFLRLGYEKCLAYNMARICTTSINQSKMEKLKDNSQIDLFKELLEKQHPFLVQGAPSSPILANLVCAHLDKRLQKLANSLGCNYSRYADDITFSANSIDRIPKTELLKDILKTEGFEINETKTKLLYPCNKQMVTGLLVNDKVRVSGKYKRDIFRHLHFCEKFGGLSFPRKICPDKKLYKLWLQGRILFVNSVEPDIAQKMMDIYINKIDWEK